MKRNIFRYTVRQTTLLLVTFKTAVRNVCLLPVHTVVDAYATCQLHFNHLSTNFDIFSFKIASLS